MRNSGILFLGSVSLIKKGPFAIYMPMIILLYESTPLFMEFLCFWNSSVRVLVYMHVHTSCECALSVGPHLPSYLRHSCLVHTAG